MQCKWYQWLPDWVCKEKHEVELGLNHEGVIVVKKILTFEKKKKEAVKL